MKIVVALDKFKGSLTAAQACAIVQRALHDADSRWLIVTKPMADGGDGTAAALHTALGGKWIAAQVTGPRPATPTRARYLWLAGRKLAVIEMASASGLVLLKPAQRAPLKTTTHGTGELIRHAIERGARRILLGVGGSATVDGGVGAAMALGWEFLDRDGKAIGLGGGELERITTIRPPDEWSPPPIEVLCDVDNSLCGKHGAARVFGPQKGATPAQVARLDAGLSHLARVVREQLGKEIANVPGAGAAGGLAAGAMAFMNARLVPGAETVLQVTELERALYEAEWVITGEGRFDAQSLCGKVVSAVTKLARQRGIKVAVLAGGVALTESVYRAAGVEVALATRDAAMPLDQALLQAEKLLEKSAQRLAQSHFLAGH